MAHKVKAPYYFHASLGKRILAKNKLVFMHYLGKKAFLVFII